MSGLYNMLPLNKDKIHVVKGQKGPVSSGVKLKQKKTGPWIRDVFKPIPKKKTKEKMKKVKITRPVVAGGGPARVGDIVEVTEADAITLFNLGKAVPAGDDAPKADERDTEKAKAANKRTAAKKTTKTSKK